MDNNMTIHPTTIKSLIPILGKSHRRRHKSTDRSAHSGHRSKRRRDERSRSVLIGEESPVRKLAKNLTNLIVALPPEGQISDEEGANTTPGGERSSRAPKLSAKMRSKSMEEKSSKYKGNSRIKKHKTIGHMKKLSKSATTLSKSFERLSSQAAGGSGSDDKKENGGKKQDGVKKEDGARPRQRRTSKPADKTRTR